MIVYEFHVNDSEGCWGDLRMEAETEEDARRACHEFLQDELKEGGSLLPDYHLDLFNIEQKELNDAQTS